MVYFQNPENALKRAKEFIEVGKKTDALEVLHEVLRMRRHRQYQHDLHEPIISLYLSLCVELRKGHAAKEGLYQYKILTQNTDINSLEKVIRKFVLSAEDRAEEASQEAKASKTEGMEDIDDLDIVFTPENLMLATVSGEDMQDRADRTLLTPWVKFLWEVYRHVLDILKNNNKVEKLYQDMAQLAFNFCIKYERKTEFRKLSDSVRNHLNLIIKHSNQANSINLNDPVSLQLHLDTRLFQLDCAIKINLWQEAIKTINDIHSLMSLSKKKPKPQALANYYKKQALVFSKANNRLFEACALIKHYQLVFEQKKTATEEEKQDLATGVLMATLAIPLPSSMSQTEKYLDLQNSTKDKNITLASYLDLQHAPTRETLLADIIKQGIPGKVYPELRTLFNTLEVDFQPLKLCSKVEEMLLQVEKLYPSLICYMKDIREVAVLRLMRQLAQVYDRIRIDKVVSLIPFIKPLQLELLIIGPSKSLDLQLRIDHATRTFTFGSTIQYQREETANGPTVQNMPSELFRNQLVSLSNALTKSVDLISPEMKPNMNEQIRNDSITMYQKCARKDQMQMIKRKEHIEKRKEFYESQNLEKELKELQEKEHTKREAEKAESRRRDEEEKRRTEERDSREQQHKIKLLKMEKVKKLMEQVGEKPFEGLSEDALLDMTEEELLARGIEHMSKEKDDLQQKMKQVEKRLDYFARAQRLEEIPKLQDEWAKTQEDDKIWWERKESERIDMAIKRREQDINTRRRLLRMVDDKDSYLDMLLTDREQAHMDAMDKFEDEIERTRLERRELKRQEILEQLAEKREKERIGREAEEKKRQKEEELLRAKEEKERSDKEASLILKKQQEKEREIEQRKLERENQRNQRDRDTRRGGDDADWSNLRRGADRRDADRRDAGGRDMDRRDMSDRRDPDRRDTDRRDSDRRDPERRDPDRREPDRRDNSTGRGGDDRRSGGGDDRRGNNAWGGGRRFGGDRDDEDSNWRRGPASSPPRRDRSGPPSSPPRRDRSGPPSSPPRRDRSGPASSPPRRDRSGPPSSPPRRDRSGPRSGPQETSRSPRPADDGPPQRKRLNLAKRTKPIEGTRGEPVGSNAANRDIGPRSVPEGRDTDRSSPRPRGDGEEQEDGFTVASRRTARK